MKLKDAGLKRERHGQFGIASTSAVGPCGFWAWGRVGDTEANAPMQEPTEPVWFTYGDTRELAVEKLKAELDQVDV